MNPKMTGLLIGAVMISFSGVWVKICNVAPAVSAFYRVLFGGIILVGAVLIRRETLWHGRRETALLLVCGVVFALDLIFYHYSIQYVGPGLGTILPNFQVFVLMGAGVVFLKEKVSPLLFLSVPLAFFGLFLIVGLNGSPLEASYKTGVWLGLATALCYSVFLLLLRRIVSPVSGVSFFYALMFISLVSSVFLGGEAFRRGDSFQIPDMQTLWALLALGALSQTAGWILISRALPGMRASLSGLILLLQPALAFVWDVWIFERPAGLWNWTGVALALGAIYMGSVGPAASRGAGGPTG
ncbi:conserved membrane hypothetical protein [Candidatus Desulfarcum epimagneticum]|uniref:EamA domain-containing protein n=1 Tax=uncultured Desulfobacteraceae bacterium TaxID=218296 RepID=A0A484HJW3_9BACT|nr:conserved membrane hypothetical protein [uncultured Desulfobacteraceae bacterium]